MLPQPVGALRLDGLRPDAVTLKRTPVLSPVQAEGAWSLTARSVRLR